MRSIAVAPLVTALAMLLCSGRALAEKDPGSSDQRAVEVAQRSMTAMGGQERLAAARLLRFDFAVVRDGKATGSYHHWWDRQTGAYRLEGVSKEGVPFRVLFDLGSKQGRAWLGDRELLGEELTHWLEVGYGRFINDSYWLLMPWKWLDDGVNLAYVGKKTVDGTEYDVVTLSFDNGVGLTSNDRYWAYVSTRTHLMERWEYVLETEEGAPGTAAPTAWAWEDWKETEAGVKLPTVRRKLAEGPQVLITFPVAEARATVGADELDAIFHPREALPPAPGPSPAAAPQATPLPRPMATRDPSLPGEGREGLGREGWQTDPVWSAGGGRFLGNTRRQEIQRILARSEVSFEDLRRQLRVPVAVLEEDLRHVERSLRAGGRRLHVEPAACPQCGFTLRQRPGRFATAGRCPECGNERLLPPRISIPEGATY